MIHWTQCIAIIIATTVLLGACAQTQNPAHVDTNPPVIAENTSVDHHVASLTDDQLIHGQVQGSELWLYDIDDKENTLRYTLAHERQLYALAAADRAIFWVEAHRDPANGWAIYRLESDASEPTKIADFTPSENTFETITLGRITVPTQLVALSENEVAVVVPYLPDHRASYSFGAALPDVSIDTVTDIRDLPVALMTFDVDTEASPSEATLLKHLDAQTPTTFANLQWADDHLIMLERTTLFVYTGFNDLKPREGENIQTLFSDTQNKIHVWDETDGAPDTYAVPGPIRQATMADGALYAVPEVTPPQIEAPTDWQSDTFYRFDDGDWTRYATVDVPESDQPLSQLLCADDSVWIAAQGTVYDVTDDAKLQPVFENDPESDTLWSPLHVHHNTLVLYGVRDGSGTVTYVATP